MQVKECLGLMSIETPPHVRDMFKQTTSRKLTSMTPDEALKAVIILAFAILVTIVCIAVFR